MKVKLKRVTRSMLSLILALTTVLSLGITARADSSDRITAFINLAAGKSVTDDTLGNMSFTKDQLRFLGIYCSNFFVPFGTELGVAGADSETSEDSIEEMTKAITSGLKMNETYAKVFAENILGLARSSATPLTVGYSKGSSQSSQITECSDIAPSYFNFLMCMLGGGSALLDKLDTDEDLSDVKHLYWGYSGGNGFTPVFDCKVDMSEGYSASQFAFLKCLESVDITNGFGFAVYDLFKSDLEDSAELVASGETALNMSILGRTMMVDCFGDIIIKGLQHQFIAVPGAVNPYTWVAVDAGGSDKMLPGQAYQAINAQSMSAYDDKNLFEGYSDCPVNTTLNEDGSAVEQGESWGTAVEYNLCTASKYCANFSTNLYEAVRPGGLREDSGMVDKNKVYKEYAGYISTILGYADTKTCNWNVTFEEDADKKAVVFKVKATNESWNSLDLNKLTSSYLNKPERNQDKKTKVVKAMNYFVRMQNHKELSSVVSNSNLKRVDVFDNGSKLITRLKGIKTDINSKDLSVVNQDTSSDGTSSVILKQGDVPKVSKIVKQLKDCSGSAIGGQWAFELRQYYGTSETKMDTSFFDKDGFKSTMIAAVNEFKKKYKKDTAALECFKDELFNSYNSAWALGTYKSGSFEKTPLIENSSSSIPLFDCMMYVDNLQQYGFDDSEGDVDWSTFPICNYIAEGTSAYEQVGERVGSKSNTFSAGYTDIQEGKLAQVDISEPMRVGLYTSYLFAGLYTEEGRSATVGKLGYRINRDNLPSIPEETIDISAEAKSDMMLTSIRDWLYYLLHPTEGLNYFRELITNKLNAFLVGIHNDMNGTFGTGITTGTSAYRNSYGYVTSPDLSEIEWTSSLINFYNNAIPFLIVAMLVTMLFTYITGILSLQKSLFGFALFAVFLFMPVNLINNVVGTSNRVSTKLYGDKFTYWALIQQETYSAKIQEAANGDSYQNYLRTLYEENASVYSNQGSESIVLKWQAPKKMASLMFSKSDNEKVSGLQKAGQDLLKAMTNVSYSGETYLEGSDNVYLYRSYLDISNFSQYIYKGLKEGNRSVSTTITNDMTTSWNEGLKQSASSMEADYKAYRDAGYTNKDSGGSTEASVPLRLKPAIASRIVTDALMKRHSVRDMSLNDYVGLNQGYFTFSIPMFAHPSSGGTDGTIAYQATHNGNEIEGNEDFEAEASRYPDEDWSSLAVYALNSENVFYYFSWLLYDLGLSTSADSTTGFKNLLLGEDEAGFFYNTHGNGELKDFMDMKSLFTYIIPYMRQCNDLVKEWDDTYGIFTYEGVTTDEGHIDDPNIVDNPELKQKYWHNLNVARLYNLYCPWVDVMYDCSYAKAEELRVQGQTYVVEDPLDPASYPKERPMIFSKSEMLDYGLTEGDLTKIEKLIIKATEGMQERIFELLNYHNFNDVTLNTAAAMNCAFVFNETFSQNGIFSNNHNIYPQTFELGDFSYDAFLRFILSNTTGEEMSSNSDFYSTVVEKSSTVTAVMLIILDIMSIYIIPAFKIFFIIAVFILSVLIILVTAFRVDSEQKFINKVIGGLIKPMLAFLAITVGFSYIISLFMGSGNTAVTRTKDVSISMGDPVTVMVAMCAVNIGAIILYWKVMKNVVSQLVREGKLVGNFIGGVVGAVGGLAMGALGINKLRGAMSGGSSGGASQSGGSGGAGGSSGGSSSNSGGYSPRAKTRAQQSVAVDKDDRVDSTRQNDAKRRAVKDVSGKEQRNEKKRQNIENATNRGLENIRRTGSNKVKETSVTGQQGAGSRRGFGSNSDTK